MSSHPAAREGGIRDAGTDPFFARASVMTPYRASARAGDPMRQSLFRGQRAHFSRKLSSTARRSSGREGFDNRSDRAYSTAETDVSPSVSPFTLLSSSAAMSAVPASSRLRIPLSLPAAE